MKELYKCPYDTAIKCCMEEGCKGCEDFTPNQFTYQYSEEFMFEFAKWCNNNYCRVVKGWLTWEYVNNPHFDDEPKPELFTTKELLEEFKKSKDAV